MLERELDSSPQHRSSRRTLAPVALAQTPVPSPRIVDVDGRPMRVLATGLEGRRAGQPVVILEAGAGEGLDNWRPAFPDIARVAPVIACDRRGIGQSAPDSATPTLRRVAASLHSLLATLAVPPPYVLVGHSWGGLFVRAYIDRYANEAAGLLQRKPQLCHRPTAPRCLLLQRSHRFLPKHRPVCAPNSVSSHPR